MGYKTLVFRLMRSFSFPTNDALVVSVVLEVGQKVTTVCMQPPGSSFGADGSSFGQYTSQKPEQYHLVRSCVISPLLSSGSLRWNREDVHCHWSKDKHGNSHQRLATAWFFFFFRLVVPCCGIFIIPKHLHLAWFRRAAVPETQKLASSFSPDRWNTLFNLPANTVLV